MSANPSPNTSRAQQKLREQAAQKNYWPARSCDELRGTFWPDTDNIDEFNAAMRQKRKSEVF